MAENSSHLGLFSVEKTKGLPRGSVNVKRNVSPRSSRNLKNLHMIPTYDSQYHKRHAREDIMETDSMRFAGKMPVGLEMSSQKDSKKTEYRRRYASTEKRTHRENRRRRRYRNKNEQHFFDPRYYWYSKSRDVAEAVENLEEVSDVPLEEGDFEEVEEALSDAEKTAEIPVGFRKYHLRHLGYKQKGFFRPKLYSVCSQRTVVNCLNMQEDESVEVDIVSEAEYDMEQDREECEQPAFDETEDNGIEEECDVEQDREECEQPAFEGTEDNEIEGEFDIEQDREENELLTFEDAEDSGMEGDHTDSGNVEVQEEVDCESAAENADCADGESVKEKIGVGNSRSTGEKTDVHNSKSAKEKIGAGNSQSAKENIDIQKSKSTKEKIDIQKSKSTKEKIDIQKSKIARGKIDIQRGRSAKGKLDVFRSRSTKGRIDVRYSKGAKGKVDIGDGKSSKETIGSVSSKSAKEIIGFVSCKSAKETIDSKSAKQEHCRSSEGVNGAGSSENASSSGAEVRTETNGGNEVSTRTYNKSLPENDSSCDLYQGTSAVQSALDSWNSHLIGLEYLLEIRSQKGEVERYHCLLCKQALPTREGRHLISHIINTRHVMRYLDKHFPSCGFKAIENSVSEIVLQKCCEDIHHALGYNSILITNCDYFEKHKKEIETVIEKMTHFDEEAFTIDASELLPREEDPPREAKEPTPAEKVHQQQAAMGSPRKSEDRQVPHKKEERVVGKQEKFVYSKPFRKTGCRSFLMLKCMEGSLLGKPTKSLKEKWRLDTGASDKTDKSTKADSCGVASKPAPVCNNAKEDSADRVMLSSETKLGGVAKDEAHQSEPEVPPPTASEIVIVENVESSASTPEPTTEAADLEDESYLEIGEEKAIQVVVQKSTPKKKPKSHQKPTTHSKHCIKRLVRQIKPEETAPKKSRGDAPPAGSSHRTSPGPGRNSGRVVRRRSVNRSIRKRSRSPHRRSRSPRKRSRSPRKRSRSPRKRSRSPRKRQIQRLFTKNPARQFSKSPIRRHSKSPGRRYSKSPGRRLSKSPGRRFSKSPVRRVYKSPFRRFSKSPRKRFSKSPVRRFSKSPIRRVYKSPVRRISKSPSRHFSKSPIRRFSRSPLRRLSRSPARRSSRSPLPRYSRSRSRTPRHQRSKSTSKSRSPQPKRRQHSFSRLRSRSPRRRRGRASPSWRGGSDLDSISDEDESLYFGAGEQPEWKHGESAAAHRAGDSQAHMFLLQMMKQITGPTVDPNDPRVQRLTQFVEAHRAELGDLLGQSAGARPFIQQYLMSSAPVQSAPPQPPYPMHETFARHPFQQSGHPPFSPTSVHNAPFANPMSYANPHETTASPMNPYLPPVPQKSKVPPEVAFKDLQATVSKLFGANKTVIETTKEKSPGGNYGPEMAPVRWGPSPQNAPGFRPDAPLFLPPHPPPNAKVSFCGPSRPPPERSLFPVMGTGEGLVTERKISLAQRLASVLVKVGMTDVPAPLLQEMLMKIGAFSSCPPQDIQEEEIIAILKRLGYL